MKEILFSFIDEKLPEESKNILWPRRQTAFSAGFDLASADKDQVIIPKGNRALISTGISIALPEGFEGQVRSRSGLSLKHGVVVLNAPGTIDADYRGEIKVILANFGEEDFLVTFGMRIAQLLICELPQVILKPSLKLSESARGAGGFGSTGIF